jgi:hypothetical protein
MKIPFTAKEIQEAFNAGKISATTGSNGQTFEQFFASLLIKRNPTFKKSK